MKRIMFICMAIFMASAAAEDVTNAFSKCAITKDDKTRLACYDKIRDDIVRANSQPLNLGRTYEQLMAGMGEYFPKMEGSRLASGEFRRMGKSDQAKAAAIFEVVGGKGVPVSRASLNFFAVNDEGGKSAAQAAILNLGGMAVVSLFVKNVFPNWLEGPKSVMEALLALSKRKIKSGEPAEGKLSHDDKTIELSYLKELGLFTVSVVPTARGKSGN